MKLYTKLVAIAAIALFLGSCKDSNTLGRHIPSAASVAIHINGKSLSEKLPWSEIKSNPLFTEVYSDSSISSSVKKILDNPDNSGIDTKGDLVFFMQRDKDGGYMALEGTIKDEAAFKTLTAEMVKNGASSVKSDINYLGNKKECVGWNKERFVFVADVPELAQSDDLTRRMQADSIDVSRSSARDITATCQSVFDLDEGKSLAKDEKFGKLVKETGDLHFWVNTEEMNKNASFSALSMLNLDKLYKGSFTTGTVNFDNGKINVSMKSYAGAEITKLYEKYGGGKVNEDMLKKMPGKDVMAIVALNFKPDGLKEFLNITNLNGMINGVSRQLNFTLDDFIKANKGDIMFGLSDFSMSAPSATSDSSGDMYEMPKPSFNFVFASSIGDKDAFNKLINSGKMLSEKFIQGNGKAPFAYNSNASLFAISNTQENADAYISGNGTNFDFISKISGEPMAGYFNVQAILKAFSSQASKDPLDRTVYDASLKLWDNVLFKGGEYKDGSVSSTAEINFIDKNTNSLKQLNQYVSLISRVKKEKDKKQKEDMMALEDAMQNGSLGDLPAQPKVEGVTK